MTFDPKSVEVTCVTLPKNPCVQVPWEYINVYGYSDQFCKIAQTFTYIRHTTYILCTQWVITIVSFWTKFRRDKNSKGVVIWASGLAQRLFPCLSPNEARVRFPVGPDESYVNLVLNPYLPAQVFAEYFGFVLHLKSYLLSILSNSFLIFRACALNILPVKL